MSERNTNLPRKIVDWLNLIYQEIDNNIKIKHINITLEEIISIGKDPYVIERIRMLANAAENENFDQYKRILAEMSEKQILIARCSTLNMAKKNIFK